jgi:hypothetical protein
VDDYLVQPAYSCVSGLNEIGVFTHELGHAFGLPDLYDTDTQNGEHQGVGTWDLMSTGSWGCDDTSPDHPCHMGAWSKLMLGWVDVVDVPAGSDRAHVDLPPVERDGVVYRVASADGSGEYFLLENRQRTGYDESLRAPGLLVWQIDPDWVANTWRLNLVNAAQHMGVRLRQADGLDDLGTPGGNRGDAQDPYPLETEARVNRVFHASSEPASRALGGSATGVTLLDIRRQGEAVGFDVLSRMYTVTVRTEDGTGPDGVFSVNGAAVAGASHAFSSAPFEANEIEAAAGEPIEPGMRVPFTRWLDDPDAPRVRTLLTPLGDVALVARYEGRQVELAMDVRGGVDGVDPADFRTVPHSEDLWFEPGVDVSIEAVPEQGFSFVGWTGALAGQPNPASLRMDGPEEAGADFQLIYDAVPMEATIEAAVDRQIALKVENGTNPVTWTILSGKPPRGMRLDPVGLITGAALESGDFVLTVEARDGIGLTATADVTLRVEEPQVGVDALASDFLLAGPDLTSSQRRYLDLYGNDDGEYDLGDFRAWVLAHPDLPMSAPARALVADPITLTIRAPDQGGGS